MYRGIDVSSHNGMVDYGTAQAAGLDFVMIRCGYGSDRSDQDDSMYLRNVQACQERDIPWGAYLYSYAMTLEEAQSELTHMLRLLNGKRPRMPIAIDMEDADGYKAARGGIDRQLATDIVRHVCAGLESAGYYAMWYCNRDWCQNHLYPEQLAAYDLWYARPGLSSPDRACGIWQDQIGSTGGSWPGANTASGRCDTNVAYKNYPSIIAAKGLNGLGGSASVPDVQPDLAPARTYTVQPGDNLTWIAAQYGTTAAALAAANGILNADLIYPGQVLTIPGAAGSVYTVQPGDTLSGIAARYGTTYQVLAAVNGITDPNIIYPGQQIRV
ncbi:LysM peptidoglycan-binding domain-containing protein [Neobittarella massiliensis]|uniref:LysM peptidoglycan-binding domain-containing protein n=1 Tax=Neobittarella massiliensis (ex Bilen et al. 2018) TaxID=2041842 RepID=A0A8J6M1I4_9FIRM|nr:LysM peptidoglycan-binding domain-containing protein [Neobittarella massiliensis]MBC3516361.1 LysM peptidoglycan-binding domain-containing protein [Neobittarella massiliensis]